MKPRALLVFLCGLGSLAALTVLFLRSGGDVVAAGDGARPAASPSSHAGSSADPGALAPPGPHGSTAAASRVALATLSGSVSVEGEGHPLPGVVVRLEQGFSTATNALGHFTFPARMPGPTRVRVEAGEPLVPFSRTLELRPGENRVELTLEPRFDLRVLVVQHAPRTERDGQPLIGARVRLQVPTLTPAATSPDVLSQAVSDRQGQCDLLDLPAGDHELVVEAAGRAPTRILLPFRYREMRRRPHLRAGSITVAVATPGSVLRGRVLGPDRSPVAGALVCLDERSLRQRGLGRADSCAARPAQPFTLSDASGAFELPLPEGENEVVLLACTAQEGLSPIVRREVPCEHLERELSVQFPRAWPVELRVVDATGRGIRGRLAVSDGVLAYDLISDPVLSTIPGFAARYAPPAGAADGSVQLSLPEGGYSVRFDGQEPPAALKAWFVTVSAEGPRELELRLDD